MSTAAQCAEIQKKWSQCLNKSNRTPEKCIGLENELRACGHNLGMDYCISETRALMNCSKKPGSDACSNEFIAMRECNRAGGAFVIGDVKFGMAPREAISKHVDPAGSGAISSTTPARSLDGLVQAGQTLSGNLGIGTEGVRF